MNVEKAINKRYSVRGYQDREIPEDKLMKILEAARMAPSARNRQDWKFVVVKDRKKREKLSEAACNQSFVAEAPVVIAAVSLNPEYIMRCDVPAWAVDLAIAVDHMTLQAIELGIGSCWIGAFYQDKAKKILGVPEKYMIVSLLTLGYPDDKPRGKNRKKINEIICFERFDQ